MIRTDNLSPEQTKVLKAKLEGKKQKDIAKEIYPELPQASAEVKVSRLLSKAPVMQQLNKLANTLGITEEQYLTNIALAMKADKMNQFTGEITPDITARLAGNKAAEKFLHLGTEEPITPPDYTALLDENDEITLQQVVFKKTH